VQNILRKLDVHSILEAVAWQLLQSGYHPRPIPIGGGF
jgi:DNA-binding CsgD family transcriptional regulator